MRYHVLSVELDRKKGFSPRDSLLRLAKLPQVAESLYCLMLGLTGDIQSNTYARSLLVAIDIRSTIVIEFDRSGLLNSFEGHVHCHYHCKVCFVCIHP